MVLRAEGYKCLEGVVDPAQLLLRANTEDLMELWGALED